MWIVTLARSKWMSNYYITTTTGSSDQLERRYWNENHVPAEAGSPGPRLSSPEERERKDVIARRVKGSICCKVCSVSNSLSHTTLSIKWEVYILKNRVRLSLLCWICSVCICVCIVVHGYTTYIYGERVSVWSKSITSEVQSLNLKIKKSHINWTTL